MADAALCFADLPAEKLEPGGVAFPDAWLCLARLDLCHAITRAYCGGNIYRWILEIAVRNLAILWVFAGLLHLWLITWARQGQEARYHVRDMAKNSTKFHFGDQLLDNILWSHVAWIFWCFWECLILWCYAKGIAPMVTFESNPIWFVAMIVAVPIWAGVHFYGLHRLLHVGWFYRHIHSWHHKNIHTGPWSGLAMHPGESFFCSLTQ